MRSRKILLALTSLIFLAGSTSALDASIQPSNPDDITLDSSNNYQVYKTFDGTASTGSITTYTWDLVGESASDSGPEANFSFSRDSSASNTVRLTVSNKTESDVAEITQVLHDVPEVSVSANTTDIDVNETVSFTATVTNSFDGPLSYDWLVDGSSKSSAESFSKTFDSEGDFDVKLNVTDTANKFKTSNTVTVSVSSPDTTDSNDEDSNDDTSTDSSGSTSTTSGATSTNLNLSDESETYSNLFLGLEAGKKAEVDVRNPEKYGVDSVELYVKNDAGNVEIKFTKQVGQPDEVSETPPGEVYRFMNITATGVKDENIDNATVRFGVNQSWIEEQNIDESTIVLRRYRDGSWNKLQTEITGRTDSRVQLEAVTPGFSYYTVSGEEKETEDSNDTQSTNSTETENSSNSTNNTETQTSEENNTASQQSQESGALLGGENTKLFLIGALIFIAIFAAGGGLYYHYREEKDEIEGIGGNQEF